MDTQLKSAFEKEMNQAIKYYETNQLPNSFSHLERAHILGQRFYVPHIRSHWWMLKVGWRKADSREIMGQITRIAASVGSIFGWVPAGNTGGANVSPIKPMPIPQDLAALLEEAPSPSIGKFLARASCLVLAIVSLSLFFAQ